MTYLIYNPLANNNTGEKIKEEAKEALKNRFEKIVEVNTLTLKVEEFIQNLKQEDVIILVGGDGTLNHFANYVYGRNINNLMYLYKAGTGNDFIRDIEEKDDIIVPLNKYMAHLPKVTINNETTLRFVNGIGYGLDGVVCEIADEQKAKGKKKINYTNIALSLLMFKYRCPAATVIIDGKEYHYKKVWLAPTMNGRFYGGGMMVTPKQDRMSSFLSSCVVHDSCKLKTLIMFPNIFKGEHVKFKKIVTINTGKKIEVKFSSPVALQVDGEVYKNVTSYVAEIDN